MRRLAINDEESPIFPLPHHVRPLPLHAPQSLADHHPLHLDPDLLAKAGELELSRRSTITRDLFSDAAYRAQHSVTNKELEALVRHDIRTLIPHRLIVDTYRPADQPPDYITDFPSYIH